MRTSLPKLLVIVLPLMGVFLYFSHLVSADTNGQLVINEIFPNPITSNEPDEWIELYNSGDEQVDLSEYKIDDIEGGSSPFQLSGIIEGKSWILLPKSVTGITLNNTNDDVRLISNSGEIIDSVSYDTTQEGKSYARIPDGNGAFEWVDHPTPNATNSVDVPTPSPSNEPSPTPTVSPTQEPTPTPTVEPTPTSQPTPTPTMEPTNTPTPEPTATPTPPVEPTNTPMPTPTLTPSPTPTPLRQFSFLNVTCTRHFNSFSFFGRVVRMPYMVCLPR